jgi:hypothetical protein
MYEEFCIKCSNIFVRPKLFCRNFRKRAQKYILKIILSISNNNISILKKILSDYDYYFFKYN